MQRMAICVSERRAVDVEWLEGDFMPGLVRSTLEGSQGRSRTDGLVVSSTPVPRWATHTRFRPALLASYSAMSAFAASSSRVLQHPCVAVATRSEEHTSELQSLRHL